MSAHRSVPVWRRVARRALAGCALLLAASGCAYWGARDADKPASTPAPRAGAKPATMPAAATPPAAPAEMPAEMARELDALLARRFAACWGARSASPTGYVPAVRLAFKPDGTLAGAPRLANTPTDPDERAAAQAALAAARRCDGTVPARFAPYHAAWRTRVLRFEAGGG